MDGIFVAIPVLFFPQLKIRIIYAIFTVLRYIFVGHSMTNGSEDNNSNSYSALIFYPLAIQMFANILFCIWPGEGSRILNIVYVFVIGGIASTSVEQLAGVREYDRQQRELDEQERKEKERLQRLRNNYYASDFYKAMEIPYDVVMNDRGIYGEYVTSTWLDDIVYPYKSLFSVCVPENTQIGSTEIDCIVLTLVGVIAIEIKNRKLRWLIDGNDKNAYCYDAYGNMREAENPIRQNKNHIWALERFILQHGDAKVQEAYKVLNSQVLGYLVFGPQTIGWNITNTKQGYCGYKGIGKIINSMTEKHLPQYDTQARREAIVTLYNFLLKYQNNIELKGKHDTLLKIKEFKKTMSKHKYSTRK
jgi:hypothetical protein